MQFTFVAMKKFITLFIASLVSILVFSQTPYEITRDAKGTKILKGIIPRDAIAKDTSFAWYAENNKEYSPHKGALEAIQKNKDSIRFIVFMGTWCHDSHFIVPKFYSLIDAAGVTQDRVTLIATDRSKKTLGNLTDAMNIINVPTIIVMKDGKEAGRVVEYGKYGLFEMELAEIIKNIPVSATK